MTAVGKTGTEETPPDEAKKPAPQPGLIVGVLAATGIVVSLAQTLVVPIIGALPEIFHTTPTNVSWIITVTLLTGSVATPILGRLADMHGKKRVLLVAITPFILGSLICALADNVATMIIGRGSKDSPRGWCPSASPFCTTCCPRTEPGPGSR